MRLEMFIFFSKNLKIKITGKLFFFDQGFVSRCASREYTPFFKPICKTFEV